MAESFGDYVRALRAAQGMSLAEFGHAVGVARQTVSHWEHGRALPRWPVLPRIAKASGLAVVDVLRAVYLCPEWEDRWDCPFESES